MYDIEYIRRFQTENNSFIETKDYFPGETFVFIKKEIPNICVRQWEWTTQQELTLLTPHIQNDTKMQNVFD